MSGRGTTSRTDNLRQVFYRFDCDGSGWVEANEFLELGEARRKLGDALEHQFQISTVLLAGQKSGSWTVEKNQRLISRMDADGNGLRTAGWYEPAT